MKLLEKLQENGWDIHWIEEENGDRELLSKSFHLGGLSASTQAGVTIAKLAAKYSLEKEINLSVSDWNVIVFLNSYNPGPLNDRFYELATDIEQ